MTRWITLLVLLISVASAQTQGEVLAEAKQQANVRATTDTNAPKVGEIFSGTQYPVVGRSEFFPWLLLADPATRQPIGWVFQDLLNVTGNLATVPISNFVVSGSITNPISPTLAAPDVTPLALPTSPASLPTAAPSFAVRGRVMNEVNIRYGPSVEFTRLGVAFAGEVFELTGYHTQFPWVQIAYPASPNGRAWIARDLLEIDGNLFSLPAISDTVLALPTLTPTPSVVGAANSILGDPVPPRPEFQALGDAIYSLMLERGFDLETSRFAAFFLMDLQTGEAVTVGSDINFSGTSVMKIGILARLYASLVAPPDAQLAVDIANTMICSENNATNRLLNVIGNGDAFRGADEVTRMFQILGLTHSFILSPYIADPNNPPVPPAPLTRPTTGIDQTRANPDFTNQLTVSDMGYLLASMYQCAYEERGPLIERFGGAYEPRECRQMLHVMSNNTVDALLKAGVPEGIRVAHKHGWIGDTHSNAALFFTPGGNYVMVMAVYGPGFLNFQQSLPMIAEASRLVYNFYNPDAPLDEIRDGFIPPTESCNYQGSPLTIDLRQPIWDQ
ncbi:serine hydrolase [Aggregatilineales bacterium SYSU G02658]